MDFISTLFGKVAVDHGYLTAEQLEAALRHQSGQPSALHLGEVLVGQGALTRAQLDEILALQAHRRICPARAAPDGDDLIAVLATRWHFCSLTELYLCVAQCRAMQEVGVDISVADQLVRRRLLTEDRKAGLARLVAGGGWPCPACGARAALAEYAVARLRACARCGAPLGPAGRTDEETASAADAALAADLSAPPPLTPTTPAPGPEPAPASPPRPAPTASPAPNPTVAADDRRRDDGWRDVAWVAALTLLALVAAIGIIIASRIHAG
ncbi:MAG: hypothetical protein HY719_04765 [Planctomycetes bacterium]|nr:hypothetical protein [Planctomycetota bacterium]